MRRAIANVNACSLQLVSDAYHFLKLRSTDGVDTPVNNKNHKTSIGKTTRITIIVCYFTRAMNADGFSVSAWNVFLVFQREIHTIY